MARFSRFWLDFFRFWLGFFGLARFFRFGSVLAQFGSVFFRFFVGFGSVRFFGYKTETEPAGFFKKLIGFFLFGFFSYFFFNFLSLISFLVFLLNPNSHIFKILHAMESWWYIAVSGRGDNFNGGSLLCLEC